jgi:protein SERAC1
VVDKESCILGITTEEPIPLDRNHRSMCRFSGDKDKMLRVVLHNLSFASKQLRTMTDLFDEQTVLQSLATSRPEVHKSRNPSPVDGTCQWIFSHLKYQTWLYSSISCLLWLSANPGCGKSVLASFLVDKYLGEKNYSKINVCYFFFKSDSKEQNNAINALQALLHQLFTAERTLRDLGVKMLHEHAFESVDSLWKVFIASFEHQNQNDQFFRSTSGKEIRDTVCVLDGLDECEPNSRKILLRLISSRFSRQTKMATNAISNDNGACRLPLLKMLVLSRPDNAIEIAFNKHIRTPSNINSSTQLAQPSMMRLRGEDETEIISNDISLVVNDAISNLVEAGLPAELLESVQNDIIARADRTFLWVTLIIDLLEQKVEAGASRRELDAILQSRDIDVIYAELLSRRPDGPKARKLLSLILAAERALTVEELSIALAIQPEHYTFEDTDQPRRPGPYTFKDVEYDLVFPFETHLKSICGHFIRIIKNKIYLVHETAREFLLEQITASEDDEWNPIQDNDGDESVQMEDTSLPKLAWQHSFSLVECHALLMEICVTYIYCLGKHSKVNRLGETSKHTAGFLNYTAKRWMIHFSEIKEEIQDRVRLSDLSYYHNLCHPRFPGFESWIEEFWSPTPASAKMHKGMSDIDVQDYYIRLLNLDPEDLCRKGDVTNAKPLDMGYSTNPSALSNFNFPSTANHYGFVSLDTLTDSLADEMVALEK